MGGGGGEGCEKKNLVCTPTKVTMRPKLRDNAVKECVESRVQVRLLYGVMCIYPPQFQTWLVTLPVDKWPQRAFAQRLENTETLWGCTGYSFFDHLFAISMVL